MSPNSDFRNRVPSFDFKVMATYASRLLSSQQQQQQSDSYTEVDVDHREDLVVT